MVKEGGAAICHTHHDASFHEPEHCLLQFPHSHREHQAVCFRCNFFILQQHSLRQLLDLHHLHRSETQFNHVTSRCMLAQLPSPAILYGAPCVIHRGSFKLPDQAESLPDLPAVVDNVKSDPTRSIAPRIVPKPLAPPSPILLTQQSSPSTTLPRRPHWMASTPMMLKSLSTSRRSPTNELSRTIRNRSSRSHSSKKSSNKMQQAVKMLSIARS